MTWLVDPIDWLGIEIQILLCNPVNLCLCTVSDPELLCTCFMGVCDVKYNTPLTKNDL